MSEERGSQERGRNPYERFEIDPSGGPEAITERMRELIEDADPELKKELRAAWEELTLHPTRRLHVALFAHPESHPREGSPPRRLVLRGGAAADRDLRDLALLPSVEECLGPGGAEELAAADLALELDPLLTLKPGT